MTKTHPSLSKRCSLDIHWINSIERDSRREGHFKLLPFSTSPHLHLDAAIVNRVCLVCIFEASFSFVIDGTRTINCRTLGARVAVLSIRLIDTRLPTTALSPTNLCLPIGASFHRPFHTPTLKKLMLEIYWRIKITRTRISLLTIQLALI